MILAFLMAWQTQQVDVESVPPVTEGIVSVEALMRLPKTGPTDRADLAVLREAILDDTEEYGHRQLLTYTAPTGEPIRCDLYPDCMRIRFGVALSEASTAVEILSNVIHHAELKDESVDAAIKAIPFRRQDYWSNGLDPEPTNIHSVRMAELVALYRHIGRPANVTVTFAAPIGIGSDLAEKWRKEVGAWELGQDRVLPADRTDQKLVASRQGKLTTFVLRGRPIDPQGNDFTSQLLATFALGGGKGSAVWKSLREGLGWSYRQEALLRNCQTGLEPVIEVVSARNDADTDRALAIRPALLKAVAAWTDEDIARALGSAKALFERGVGLNPLYFKSTHPVGEDALFLRTYWRMKTGADWDNVTFLDGMSHRSLKDVQAAATAMLESANVEIIRGRD